jgi:iron complex outermembrane receptor protein
MSQPIKQFLIFSAVYLCHLSSAYSDQGELMGLSVEDLLNVEVISVAKKAKSLNDSPAAIFVISQDDIRRIGATSIPEALRLAPGLDVARIDSNKWAVSARGFNGRFANKLLVLIDGRSVYTRAFAGVYWENQDVMLEDVERIEVIRGPGATLWGANAVYGVINIITKHSADTQGGLLVAGVGTEEQGFGAFRYGGKLSSDTTARAYIKGFNRDENTHKLGGDAGDDWNKVQGGFRMDSQLTTNDTLTLQGDVYHSSINQYTTFAQVTAPYRNSFNEKIDAFGGNLLMRQHHTFSSTSDYSLQVFYDFYERDEVAVLESRHTLDVDFQHRFALLNWNDVVWGIAYRYSHDDVYSKEFLVTNTPSRNDQLVSAFVQDEITLVDNYLWLTVGSKFEHNDYSGFEVQPTARLMWAPHQQHRLWAAVSRAVRTPSRVEQDTAFLQSVIPAQPPFIPAVAVSLEGNKQYDSK